MYYADYTYYVHYKTSDLTTMGGGVYSLAFVANYTVNRTNANYLIRSPLKWSISAGYLVAQTFVT